MEETTDPDGDEQSSICKYIQGVVEHNSQQFGINWPSDDHLNTMATHNLPLLSPGGANVQPSPKDSGVDVNSPCRNLEPENSGMQTGMVQKSDSQCDVKEMTYGPSSVESGAVMESDPNDLDQGVMLSDNEAGLIPEEYFMNRSHGDDHRDSLLTSCVMPSTTSQITQSSLSSTNECAISKTVSCSATDHNASDSCCLSPTISHNKEVSSSNCLLQPVPAPSTHSSISGQHETNTTLDIHHKKELVFMPENNVAESAKSDLPTLRSQSPLISETVFESENACKLTDHPNRDMDLESVVVKELNREILLNETADTKAASIHDTNSQLKSITLSEKGSPEHPHSESTSHCQVSPSSTSSDAPSATPLVGIQNGFHDEFAKFLQNNDDDSDKNESEDVAIKARPCVSPVKRKHRFSVSGAVDAGSMLPVIKIRKISPGKYTALPRTASASAELSSPRLKIKFGSSENGGKREEVHVPLCRSISLPLCNQEVRKEGDNSEDEIDLDESFRSASQPHSGNNQAGCIPNVPDPDPYELKSDDDNELFVEPPWVSRVTRCKTIPPPPRTIHHTPHRKFCVKSFVAANTAVISLRRKVMRLLRLLFPDLRYPSWFRQDGPHVDALIEQVSGTLGSTGSNDVPREPLTLPIRNSCCLEAVIVVCQSPKACLRKLRRRICHLIDKLLPELELGGEFDRHSASVDELLQKVYQANRRALVKSVERT